MKISINLGRALILGSNLLESKLVEEVELLEFATMLTIFILNKMKLELKSYFAITMKKIIRKACAVTITLYN